MALAYQPYNLTLPSYSPVFNYAPFRDGDVSLGWNSSYTDYSVNDALNNQAAVAHGYFRGIGIAYRNTSYPGASVSLNFTGTAIYLCLSTPSPGQYTLTLDGSQISTTAPRSDPACAIYGSEANTLAVSTDLQPGSHSAVLELTASSGGSMSFYGATVTINAGSPGPKTSRIISSADQGWDYQGNWMVETDDNYMWDGQYKSAQTYGQGNTATFTFQNASAVILRGLSMFNYGPYTVTLNGGPAAAYNASDLYWRHSRTIIYFESGLDPNQSYTVQLANFDANYPDAKPIGSTNLINAAVDTLELITDDIETRDALLATLPSQSQLQSPNPPQSQTPSQSQGPSQSQNPSQLQSQSPLSLSTSPSSNTSPSTIAAAVLGSLVFVLLGLSTLFLILWQRANRRIRLATQTPEPWKDTDVTSPSWGGTSFNTGAMLGAEPAGLTGGRTIAPQEAAEYKPRKQGLRAPTDASNVMMFQRSPVPTRYSATGSDAPQPVPAPPVPIVPIGPPVPPPPAQPQVLSQLVGSLSTLLNGHLHAEYLQRERDLDGISEGLPGYRNE